MIDNDFESDDAWRPTSEWDTCDGCGAELTLDNLPAHCTCGRNGCRECMRECEWCNGETCGSCATHTVDGWAHKDICAAELKESEDARDMR